jgi:16S rRNA (cytosine967-C5)-methyltransferase
MRLHRNLVEAVVNSLLMIFEENRYADKVIEKVLQSNPKWGARDRAFIAENFYEIVRWWRLLLFLAEADKNTKLDKVQPINFYWRIFGVWQISQNQPLPDWEEFKNFNIEGIKKQLAEAKKTRKIIESVPDWIDEIGEKELGEKWHREVNALNFQAPVVLRTNRLKTTRGELQKLLANNNILTQTIKPIDLPFFKNLTQNKEEIENFYKLGLRDALVLEKRANVFSTPLFKNGLFEVQDAASQLVAPFVDVQEGMRVIDACAGAGGKTLHLAALMNNKGRIIAMDSEAWKLEELKKRARRNGATTIEPRVIDSTKVIKRLADSADRLLLDVPCSGLGVLRRNPDAKWKLQEAFLDNIKKTQAEILQNYSSMLRKDGKMVYATCSILPSESEDQVRKFLAAQDGKFELIGEQRISPADTNFDGFYMACLKRVV